MQQKAELTERLYEHQRPLIDYPMGEHKLPEEQWNELAFALFQANVKKWETIRKRTLGDFETLGPSGAIAPLPGQWHFRCDTTGDGAALVERFARRSSS